MRLTFASVSRRFSNKIPWFYFEYDFGVAKPILSLNFAGNTTIVAIASSSKLPNKVFLYRLEGEYDQKVLSNLSYANCYIKSSFTTGANEFNKDRRKNIVGVEFVFTNENSNSTNDIKVSYLNENKNCEIGVVTADEIINPENIIKKNSCVFGVRHFGVSLSCDGNFGIKQIKYIYK